MRGFRFNAQILASLFLCIFFGCRARVNAPAPPAPESTLRVAAEAHRITIGTAAHSRYLREPEYEAVLASEFSQLEPENELKFAVVHPAPDRYDFSGGDVLLSFAESHDMLVRGHTLVWHRQVPQWLSSAHHTPAQLAMVLRDHIKRVMLHYAGKLYAWDVVNEAFNDDGSMRTTVWYDQPGIGYAGGGTRYVEQAFRWARASDPKAHLFYNDYDTEQINAKSDAIYAMAKDFKARGVPLDGIGFQFHLDLRFDNPNKLASTAENMRRFAALGLEINITELDVRLSDGSPASLHSQASLYHAVTKLCVAQPACKVLQAWGFTDKHSWIPGFFPNMDWGLPFDKDYKKKPAYYGMLGALQ